MRHFLQLTLCLILAAPVLPFQALAESKSPVLGRVNGYAITSEAFRAEMTRRNTSAEQKESLLEEMIRFEVLHGAAQQQGLDRDPEILDSLKKMVAAKYREKYLDPLLAQAQVSDAEVESYYGSHRDEFVVPARVRAAIIQISVPKRASEQKRQALAARAQKALAEARQLSPETRSFGGVAVRYSDDQASRYRGGDTGWIKAGQQGYPWEDQVMAAVFALRTPSELSQLITTRNGHYLAKLIEHKESSYRPFAEVSSWIRQQILKDKKSRIEDEFYASLKARADISVDQALLKAIPAPSNLASRRPPALPQH